MSLPKGSRPCTRSQTTTTGLEGETQKREVKIARRKSVILESYQVHEGLVIKVEDTVMLKSTEESGHFIAKIKSITKTAAGPVRIKVTYFCRLGDKGIHEGIPGIRKRSFYGEKELLSTTWEQTLPVSTVLSHCNVHTSQSFMALKQVTSKDFYERFHYDEKTGKITLGTVKVHCDCRAVECPHDPLFPCVSCEKWYHPRCHSMTVEEVSRSKGGSFVCKHCRV